MLEVKSIDSEAYFQQELEAPALGNVHRRPIETATRTGCGAYGPLASKYPPRSAFKTTCSV
jgi:hypothetical protein